MPVASFCASETAETGRIANGCEQGDHVSRRQGRRKSTRSVLERVAKLRFTTRSRFVRSRLMPKSSAFRHSRIYRRKIRGACPRIFRIFIEIGLRPKSLIDFCNSLKHTECAVPAGTKAFLSYFLCPTKSMEKFPAGNAFGGYAAEKSTRSVPSRQGQTFCEAESFKRI